MRGLKVLKSWESTGRNKTLRSWNIQQINTTFLCLCLSLQMRSIRLWSAITGVYVLAEPSIKTPSRRRPDQPQPRPGQHCRLSAFQVE